MNTDLIKAQDVQFLEESTTYELEGTEQQHPSKKEIETWNLMLLGVAMLLIGSILALVTA